VNDDSKQTWSMHERSSQLLATESSGVTHMLCLAFSSLCSKKNCRLIGEGEVLVKAHILVYGCRDIRFRPFKFNLDQKEIMGNVFFFLIQKHPAFCGTCTNCPNRD